MAPPSIWLSIALSAGAAALATISWAHPAAHTGSDHRPTSEETAAYHDAKPVFEKFCGRCHSTAGPKAKRKSLDHFRMDGYPFGGHHAHDIGKVVREAVLGKGSRAPTMPKNDPGSVKGEDLKRILTWAEAFDHGVAHATEKPR